MSRRVRLVDLKMSLEGTMHRTQMRMRGVVLLDGRLVMPSMDEGYVVVDCPFE